MAQIILGYCVECGRRVSIDAYWTGDSPWPEHLLHAADDLPGFLNVAWTRTRSGHRLNCWTLPIRFHKSPVVAVESA